jgi:hypothetical protein
MPTRERKPPKRKEAFQVVIVIQRFSYDPKVGSHARVIEEPYCESEHGNWPMGDYQTLAQADAVVAGMVKSEP